jgi:hypothetical protein
MNSYGAVKDAKVLVAPMYCISGMKNLELIKAKDVASVELPSLNSDISFVMQARVLEGYSLDVCSLLFRTAKTTDDNDRLDKK